VTEFVIWGTENEETPGRVGLLTGRRTRRVAPKIW